MLLLSFPRLQVYQALVNLAAKITYGEDVNLQKTNELVRFCTNSFFLAHYLH